MTQIVEREPRRCSVCHGPAEMGHGGGGHFAGCINWLATQLHLAIQRLDKLEEKGDKRGKRWRPQEKSPEEQKS